MSSMSLHLDRGEKFLECIQGESGDAGKANQTAQVIVATVDQYNAWYVPFGGRSRPGLTVRWTDLWMLSGSAMRLAIPTRLNESSSECCRRSGADK
jgi:hypothetical protein